uniref:Uncharacterized protein n=1 Tax=Ditylenchus dipsaci TaxID=166011 RepID=A0A915DA17_9BILA
MKLFNAGNASFVALQDGTGTGEDLISNLYALDLQGDILNRKSISVVAKDMAVFDNKIYLLDRFNNTIHVYDGELDFEKSMEFENTGREICNFIHAAKQYIFVSCQSAILQFSVTGNGAALVQQYGIPESSYSLPIQLLSLKSLLVVQRGREEIHVFDYENKTPYLKTKLIRKEDEGEKQPINIWSALEMLRNSTLLLVLEHLSNTVKILAFPGSFSNQLDVFDYHHANSDLSLYICKLDKMLNAYVAELVCNVLSVNVC